MVGGYRALGSYTPLTLSSLAELMHWVRQAVESAFVPVMKTVISGVEVDLLFARVNLAETGDKLDIEKDEILRGVDDASQRSLNGTAAQLAS